jgi:hypothetical protein
VKIRFVIQNSDGEYLARHGGSGQYSLQKQYAQNCLMRNMGEAVDAIIYELKNIQDLSQFRVTKYDMSQPIARVIGTVSEKRLLILVGRRIIKSKRLSEPYVRVLKRLRFETLFRKKREDKVGHS